MTREEALTLAKCAQANAIVHRALTDLHEAKKLLHETGEIEFVNDIDIPLEKLESLAKRMYDNFR